MRKGRTRHTDTTTYYGSAHLRPYIAPWATWAALPAIGTITHAMASTSVTAGVAVGATTAITAAGLTAFAHRAYRSRGESIQLQATATTAAAGAWTLWSTASGLWQTTSGHGWNLLAWIGGVFQPWPWGAWALIGPAFAGAWTIRRIAQTSTADQTTDQTGLLEKIRIAGRVRKAELEAGGNRVRAEIEVARGTHTIGDVQNAIGNVASALGVRTSAVRVIPDPDDAARGTLTITPRDLLAQTIPWPGPSAPGGSIAEPINVGVYEDGETARLWLPGDHKAGRNLAHLAISGMSGAGKTESGLALLGDAMTRRDVSVIYSDTVKGLQSCAPIAPGLALLLTDQQAAIAGLKALKVAISARTTQLGRHGFKQWEAKSALPVAQRGAELKLLVYWLEESAALIADSTSFVQLTEQARSAGIVLVLSQQRLTHDRIDTSARANLGAMWCFGVRDDKEKYGLSESTIEAGAAPWEWRNNKPGYSYLEAPGVPEEQWSIKLRSFYPQSAALTETVLRYADPTLDQTTGAAFASLYTDYQTAVREGRAIWQTGPQTTALPVHRLTADQTTPEETTDMDQDDDGLEHLDFLIPPQPEPGFCDDIDPSIEIAETDDGELMFATPPPSRPLTTDQARHALRAMLQAMADRGDMEVRTGQLVEFRQHVGRQAPWLSKELRRLAADGLITIEAESGTYGLAPLRTAALTAV